MGKLKCICGNILSDTCGYDAEAFTEDQTIRTDINETDGFEDDVYIMGDGRSILECDECGALAIENPINSPNVEWYIPENGKPKHLFKGK